MASNYHSYPPSQFTVDENGDKWRLCAAAAVLNSSNQLLVGQRVTSSHWQCAQGGVDADPQESIAEAATRELYEEMGLTDNQNVVLLEENIPPVRYKTSGTNGWMKRAGFVGQELHWVIFRYIGEDSIQQECDLNGLNGEKAEFNNVKWCDFDEVVDGVQEKKRKAYQVLADYLRKNQLESG